MNGRLTDLLDQNGSQGSSLFLGPRVSRDRLQSVNRGRAVHIVPYKSGQLAERFNFPTANLRQSEHGGTADLECRSRLGVLFRRPFLRCACPAERLR